MELTRRPVEGVSMVDLVTVFETVVETLFRTFGPFVIPATIFVVGLAGYGALFLFNRWRDGTRTPE